MYHVTSSANVSVSLLARRTSATRLLAAVSGLRPGRDFHLPARAARAIRVGSPPPLDATDLKPDTGHRSRRDYLDLLLKVGSRIKSMN